MSQQEWSWRREISGALGDIGVFFPLAVALITLNGMSATGILLAAGLFYILSGLYFRLPMPVQPLKALSVIAIATHAGPALIAASGLVIGAVVLALSALGWLQYLARIFPKTLVRGIQLGIGFILVKSGIGLMLSPQLAPSFPSLVQHSWGPLPYGLWIGLAVFVVLLLYGDHQSFPATPLVILFGHLMGWFLGMAEGGINFQWGASALLPGLPTREDFLKALFLLVLPQLPLSFGNALVGTASAARAYFPQKSSRVTIQGLGVSYGVANLCSALIGGMPMCQGAGGLTAHVRFGARTARATIFLGTILIALGVLTGKSAPALLSLIPSPVLGALLCIVGWEHCKLARDVSGQPYQVGVVIVVGATSLLTGNLLFALLAGLAAGLLLGYIPRRRPWSEVLGPFDKL